MIRGAERAPEGVASGLFQYRKCGFVVRFIGDLADKFAMQDLVVLIKYDYRAGGEACEAAIQNLDTVIFSEFRCVTESGERHDVIDAFCTAEAALGERQVG